ncbi:Multidrug resistance-associated protein 1 [Acipenser ruthenus]|uniref:ABC-type glutathione-S-conjugate transporter n=1 Tax=Acipenser ruthenus TaxID=7906 RepID=A0A444UPR3_ACIRT|nr:Multidrug resistance-associated protein 1 [Acipenser ruthenus]
MHDKAHDWNRTWYTPNPDLTQCFQNTVLVWVPCIYLWVCAPFYFLYLYCHDRGHIRMSCLCCTKVVLGFLLASFGFVEFFYILLERHSEIQQHTVFLVSPVIRSLSVVLAVLLIQYERRQGCRSSVFLFIYWLLSIVCALVPLRAKIQLAVEEGFSSDAVRYAAFFSYFALLLAELVLSCFADQRPFSTEPNKETNPCPDQDASFLSKILFWWFTGLVVKGYRKPLKAEDLWSLRKDDTSEKIISDLEQEWTMECARLQQKTDSLSPTATLGSKMPDQAQLLRKLQKEQSSGFCLLRALARVFGPYFLSGTLCLVVHDVFMFSIPQVLSLLLAFMSDADAPLWKGYFYAALMFLVSCMQSLFNHQYMYSCFTVGMRVKTAVMGLVYRKSLVITNAARRTCTVGEIVNLVSADTQKLMDFVVYFNAVWLAPIEITLCLFFLWQHLGPSALAGIATIILIFPLNGVIAKQRSKLQEVQMKHTDGRIKLMNEILNGIKILKFYAWEKAFLERVLGYRAKELKALKKSQILYSISIASFNSSTFLIAFVMFGVYVLIDERNVLDAQKVFVSMALINILKTPLSLLPFSMSTTMQHSTGTLLTHSDTALQHSTGTELTHSDTALQHSTGTELTHSDTALQHSTGTELTHSDTALQHSTGTELTHSDTALQHSTGTELTHSDTALQHSTGTLLTHSEATKIPNRLIHRHNSQALVSLKRLGKFLCQEELKSDSVDRKPLHPAGSSVLVENGTFSWSRDGAPCLKRISVSVARGSLVAVVGHVGSGKSSLLSALLGEMEKKNGRVSLQGSVAYVPQQAWIQNATLRDNIVFGQERKERWYQQVVEACALVDDLEILPAGDETEIGEKGLNLSGGQKQRVSLARAVYREADVYLLDDPLSAVDAHVGQHIFEKVIGPKGVLRDRTRVLVTHGLSYLPQVDLILVLVDGEITEMGSYQELLNRQGAFAEFIRAYTSTECKESSAHKGESCVHKLVKECGDTGSTSLQNVEPSSETDQPQAAKDAGKLTEADRAKTGRVKMAIYMEYFKTIGLALILPIIFLYVFQQAASISYNYWLSMWADDPVVNGTQLDTDFKLGVYGALGFAQGIAIFGTTVAISVGGIIASRHLHQDLLHNMLRSPMSFFERTPSGNLLNRFSKEVDAIDCMIPDGLKMMLGYLFKLLEICIIVLLATPITAVIILPLGLFYGFIQSFYVATSCQLRRLESVSRSPIYTHFNETVQGASVIRAFGEQPRFILQTNQRVDENQKSYFPRFVATRWLAVNLEFLGNCIVLSAAIFSVMGKGILSPGIVGLSVSHALQVTGILSWIVRSWTDVENNIVSVERVKEYADTPKEAAWTLENSPLSPAWPQTGTIELRGYGLQYRKGLEWALKDISIHIQEREKARELRAADTVGIVGRTGAGKSSLALGIFRILEAAKGEIYIDGINIAEIGLHELRTRITIIPQDPVLFSGTLRMNLDPFDAYSDEEVWNSLELAHLKNFVSGLPDRLNHECSEGGENLSLGQRQLVCLARALLRKTKILVLDEATAAVDLETDNLIQSTIRSQFEECTVLTIAHRLNTVMDYTRVIVMDKGLIVESDSPSNLIGQRGHFYRMCREASLV